MKKVLLLATMMFNGALLQPGEHEIQDDAQADELQANHDRHVAERQALLIRPDTTEDSEPDADKLLLASLSARELPLSSLLGLIQEGITAKRWTPQQVADEAERVFDKVTWDIFDNDRDLDEPEDPTKPDPVGEVQALENRVKELEGQLTEKTQQVVAAPPPAEKPAPPPADTPAATPPATQDVKVPPAVLKALKAAGFDPSKPETVRAASDEQINAIAGVTPDILAKLRTITAE